VGRGRWFPAGRSRTRAQSELAFHASRNASTWPCFSSKYFKQNKEVLLEKYGFYLVTTSYFAWVVIFRLLLTKNNTQSLLVFNVMVFLHLIFIV